MTTASLSRQFQSFTEITGFIWAVADLLRGDYKQADYGKVILPFTVLRRLDCVLRDTKPKVLAKAEAMKGGRVKEQNLGPVLNRITGVPFHNVSKLDFEKLKGDPNHIGPNLLKYIEGFSADVRDSFVTSGLFRNCETGDATVWAVEVTGEDTGIFHHVAMPGDAAVSEDPNFFDKVFCINSRESAFYARSLAYSSHISEIPRYFRQACQVRPACLDTVPRCMIPEPATGWCPTPTPTIPGGWHRIDKSQWGFGFALPDTFIDNRIDYDNEVFAALVPSQGGMLVYVLPGAIDATMYPTRETVRVGSQTGYMCPRMAKRAAMAGPAPRRVDPHARAALCGARGPGHDAAQPDDVRASRSPCTSAYQTKPPLPSRTWRHRCNARSGFRSCNV